jgi:iron(III) transport system permease protein
VGVVVALAIAAPLLTLPASFIGESDTFDQIGRTLLPHALRTSLFLAVGVGVGTLVVGGGLALLVTFWDFPGRRWLDWALVLPMAMPAYVLVFVLLAQYGLASPLQANLFGDGLQIRGIRSPAGAIVVLTGVLYPYVYVLGRSAFLGQSRQAIEAARSLGRTYGQAIRQVAIPLARPALAAGVSLAVMETLADFGAVNLLGVQALTSVIYRVWYGAFDQDAALQLATVLVGLALTMLVIERAMRGRARYHQALGSGDAVIPVRLRGWRGIVAAVPGSVLLLLVFAVPVAQLIAWSVETIADGEVASDITTAARNTLVLGVLAAVIAVATATIVVYGQRAQPSKVGLVSSRIGALGYAVPGTVVAVAVYVPLVWIDRHLIDIADEWFGVSMELLFTGTFLGLLVAYVVRFHALAFFSVDARMGRISPSLDDAARSLGADRARVLADVHLPLLGPGLLTAGLLVLVDVMKELPATALLRPLGGDTLAVTVWEATKDSRFDTAALPALLIVAVGLIPVILLVRLTRRDGWTSAADTV